MQTCTACLARRAYDVALFSLAIAAIAEAILMQTFAEQVAPLNRIAPG